MSQSQSQPQSQPLRTPLFGGALSIALPPGFADVSRLRAVPDHQEVFCDAASDAAFIVELTEPPAGVADADAARAHLEDVNAADDAEGVEAVAALPARLPPPAGVAPPGATAPLFVGARACVARVAKFSERARNRVAVLLAVARLPPPAATDVLLTLSLPLRVDAASSSAATMAAAGGAPGGAAAEDEAGAIARAARALEAAVASLAVHDWGLFGDGHAA